MLTRSNFAWAANVSTRVSCSRFEKSGKNLEQTTDFFHDSTIFLAL